MQAPSRTTMVLAVAALVASSCGSGPDADAPSDSVPPTTSALETTAAVTSTTEPPPTESTTVAPTSSSTAPPTTAAPTTVAVTTVATPASTAIEGLVECEPSGRCTELLTAPSGSVIAVSPSEPVLTRFASGEVESQIDLPVEFDSSGGSVLAIGPEDVAYLALFRPEGDERGDVVAVATTGPAAGTVIAEWPSVVDPSGDTEYIPTANGLVPVGCCDLAKIRPDSSESPVVEWVDNDGAPTAGPGPYVAMQTGDSGNELIVTDGSSERRFPLPSVAQSVRGMPWVQPLDDGGLIAAFFEQSSGASYYAVYPPDGAGERNFSDAGESYVHSFFDVDDTLVDGPAMLALLGTGDAVVRVGDEIRRIDVRDVGPRMTPTRLVGDDWTLSGDDLNQLIDTEQPTWARSPELVARSLALDWYPNESTNIQRIAADGTTVTVQVTTEGFLDDSVFASRRTIVLEAGADGLFRFVSGERSQQCQPGRGHQDFRAEFCI